MGLARCPTCGSDLGGRAICSRCGTLVSAEMSLAKWQNRARGFFEERVGAIGRNLRVHHFLWACAFMPFFILPPLVAFVVAVKSMRQPAGGDSVAGYEWLAIISVLNIILSALVLYKFHFSPHEVLGYFTDFARAIFRSFFHFVPLQPSGPKLTPV